MTELLLTDFQGICAERGVERFIYTTENQHIGRRTANALFEITFDEMNVSDDGTAACFIGCEGAAILNVSRIHSVELLGTSPLGLVFCIKCRKNTKTSSLSKLIFVAQ